MIKESFRKIAWEIVITFLGVFALIWGFAEPIGFEPGISLFSFLIFSSLCISIGYTGVRLIMNFSKMVDSYFCEVNDPQKIKGLLQGVTSLKIFASGSETYRTPLLNFLKECDLKEKLYIQVLLRDDGSDSRDSKLIEAKEKWMEIDEIYNTKTEIRSYNFNTGLRGMIFGNKSAILGWYHRKNSKTLGQTIPVFYYSSNNNNSQKVIDFAVLTFNDIFENAEIK